MAFAHDAFIAMLTHWSASPEGVAAELGHAPPDLNLLSPQSAERLLADAYAHAELDAGAAPDLPPATVVVDDEDEEVALPAPEPENDDLDEDWP